MIKLTDGSVIDFKKIKNGRYEMRIKTATDNKTITLHLPRSIINLLQFEIDELLSIK